MLFQCNIKSDEVVFTFGNMNFLTLNCNYLKGLQHKTTTWFENVPRYIGIGKSIILVKTEDFLL